MTPDQFKATRKKLGFTQAELAEEWGVHVQSIRNYERGLYPIDLRVSYGLLLMNNYIAARSRIGAFARILSDETD
jgi:DNA-binding XRE family transcriptional regulator